VEEVLAQVGLTEAAGQQVRSFSTGMKQRLAIARALLHDPPILFLDEPTSGLDPLAAHRFRQFLTQLAQDRQRTIFLSTHMPEEIEQLCDRVLFLHRGRSLAAGTLDTIRRSIRANPQYDIDVLGQPHLRGDRLELVVSSCCRSLPGARLLSIQPHRQRTDEYCLQVEFDAQLDRAAVAKFLQGLQRDCGLAVVECRQRQISLADLYAALTGGADLHAA
jgi:ABC-2 type transport system ATP-binding protein